MPAFTIFWLGQVISLVGTNMSTFGLTIWAYKTTGSATALSLVAFFYMLPLLVVSPLAGALVDRSNRKLMMIISDLASGLATIAIMFLYFGGSLQVWHLYIMAAFSGTFQAFQWPAFSAAITLMLDKSQYGRANGMMSLAEAGSGVFAPVLAGALLGLIGLGGILLIDVVTFVLAVSALLVITVPQPKTTQAGEQGRGSLRQESIYGFWYIIRRPSLLGLQLVFMVGNFISGIAYTLLAPMILARSGNDEVAFATVNSIGALGGVLGGVAVSIWGIPKRHVHGVLFGWILFGLFGVTPLGLSAAVVIWAAGNFFGTGLTPLINGSNQTIWQSKVAPDVQGRVFSMRRLIAWFTGPLSALIAGPLADYVMEPAMQSEGMLRQIFGPLVGSGPGAGMAVLFVVCGLATALVGVVGYLIPVIYHAEKILPDHDQDGQSPAGEVQTEGDVNETAAAA